MTPVVVGGGGIRGGQIVGQTNETGLEISSGEVTVPDLFATLLQALGIDPAHEFRTEFGAMLRRVNHGTVIKSLI